MMVEMKKWKIIFHFVMNCCETFKWFLWLKFENPLAIWFSELLSLKPETTKTRMTFDFSLFLLSGYQILRLFVHYGWAMNCFGFVELNHLSASWEGKLYLRSTVTIQLSFILCWPSESFSFACLKLTDMMMMMIKQRVENRFVSLIVL